jgi:hypothetical protein
MQMSEMNLAYARWLASTCTNCRLKSAAVEAANAEGPDAVLALVSGDEYSFASGAWFLATQCSGSVRDALDAGADAGWDGYMGCVGVEATEERTAMWRSATALGQW